jgi:LysM repeat protein
MRYTILLCFLLLAACGPSPATGVPVPPDELVAYLSATPSPTPLQAEGLVVSLETPLPSPTPFTYSVKSGDTLSQIAEHFHVSLDALMAANPNVDPSGMSIGQVLKIPSSPQNPTGEGTPTPVPFPVQAVACHPSPDRGAWCFVLARNDSPYFMENVTAQVTLLDADGRTIASQAALPPLNILPPQQSMPLAVFFAPEVPAGARPRVQILTAIRLLPGDERYLPAAIQNSLVQVDWDGLSARVNGQVILPASSQPARQVWVAAVAYDAAGGVVGVRRWESGAGLAAGGSLPFSFMVSSVGGGIARVEFAVEARP